MNHVYMSLLSLAMLISPTLYSMNWHQRAVDEQQKGLDLRAEVPLEDHQQYLPFEGKTKSLRELFDDCERDASNIFNNTMLYVFDKSAIASYGSLAHRDDKMDLLKAYTSSIYVLYTKRGKEIRALLLGTSDITNIRLLTAYLIFKSSNTKENEEAKPNNQATSGPSSGVRTPLSGSNNRIVEWPV